MLSLAAAEAPPLPAHPEERRQARLEGRTCNLSYIRRELGRETYGDQRMVTYLRKLQAECGFPDPLPTLVKVKLAREIVPASLWLRDAVDAWLDAQYPAEVLAAHADADRAAAAAEMDERALNLGAANLRVVK